MTVSWTITIPVRTVFKLMNCQANELPSWFVRTKEPLYKSLDQIFKKVKKSPQKRQKLDLLAPAEYKSLDQIFKNY